MSQKRGVFILSAGPNASGKSTVIKPRYIANRVKHYLDPDRLMSVAENDILSLKARTLYESKQPAKFAIECMKDWLASERIRSEGIATESNLVTQKHDFECFRVAKESGMRTELYFVGLPYDTAKEREKIRVANGEQDPIDPGKFDRRYKNGPPNIQKHLDSGNIDVLMVYDNSRGKGEEQLLLHVENGKTLFLHPDPPQWFRDAEIKIPPFSEKQAEQPTQSNGQTADIVSPDQGNDAPLAIKDLKKGMRVICHAPMPDNTSIPVVGYVSKVSDDHQVRLICGSKAVIVFGDSCTFTKHPDQRTLKEREQADISAARQYANDGDIINFADRNGISRGPILAKTPEGVIQRTSAVAVTIHFNNALGEEIAAKLKAGDDVVISYREGKATVTPHQSRRNNDRDMGR